MSTWGPTALAANADDGNDAGGWNVSGFGNLNYFDVDTYPAWSFPLPAIAAGATISKMYLAVYSGTATDGGDCVLVLRVEDADPATQTAWGASHLPSAATPINTDMAGVTIDDPGDREKWLFGEGQAHATNLASALQDIVDKYGAITAGQRINIWGIRTSGGSVGVYDYNQGTNRPTLYIEWTEGAGPPIVASIAVLEGYSRRRRN